MSTRYEHMFAMFLPDMYVNMYWCECCNIPCVKTITICVMLSLYTFHAILPSTMLSTSSTCSASQLGPFAKWSSFPGGWMFCGWMFCCKLENSYRVAGWETSCICSADSGSPVVSRTAIGVPGAAEGPSSVAEDSSSVAEAASWSGFNVPSSLFGSAKLVNAQCAIDIDFSVLLHCNTVFTLNTNIAFT